MGNESHEDHEGNGRNESHEGNEEEANLLQACKASPLCRQAEQDSIWNEQRRLREEQVWQDRQQEAVSRKQEVTLDCSMPECPQGTEDQGFRSHQEGYSTLQEGQGALHSVSTLSRGPAPDVGLSTSVERWSLLKFLAILMID